MPQDFAINALQAAKLVTDLVFVLSAMLPQFWFQINANNVHTIAVFAPMPLSATITAPRTTNTTLSPDNAYQTVLKESSWPDSLLSASSSISCETER